MQKSDSREKKFSAFEKIMLQENLSRLTIDKFRRYYFQLLSGDTGMISETDIDPVETLPDAADLSEYSRDGIQALEHTAVIKLNGGLGTSMGMSRAKALLPVKRGLSFLDIIVRQTLKLRQDYGVQIPLIFMNSLNTRKDTLDFLTKYPELAARIPFDFVQERVPKIDRNTLQPAVFPDNPALEWCPPGHGDIYHALKLSGLLKKLLDSGFKIVFISNSDNLGAVLDLNILGYFSRHRFPFMMEVADRTFDDRKGGHLARSRETGGLMLREVAQCPEAEISAFQDIKKYRYFNTNSIWLRLDALHDLLTTRNNILNLPLICNKKTIDPTRPDSTPVYQLETAMGAAISQFQGASALRVPRSRFLPVKTCRDLIGLWSDAYLLSDDYHLILNPERKTGPRISLDPTFYKLIQQVSDRFPHGAPSLLECTSWTVQGDFSFGKNVRLAGSVEMVNTTKDQVHIPDGGIFENETLHIPPDTAP